MAALPSSQQTRLGCELKNIPSNEISKNSESNGFKAGEVQNTQSGRKSSYDRVAVLNAEPPLPGTYYLKANEARGKHMVQYVYANLTDPNDESLPFHIRERYKELQRERVQGYQPFPSPRGKSPSRQHGTANYNFVGNKMQRPASASYERRANAVSNDSGPGPGKTVTDAKQAALPKPNLRAVMKNIQQTRSSNAVLSPKRSTRSRSKTNSPRPRRPFSIAAESTSDTDPIENQRSIESVPHRSPPRISNKRQVRREQYLATKFKLAAKNSKHTQTFVAAAASMGESSGSATTVISRHHSTTQTEIVSANAAITVPNQTSCETGTKPEEKDVKQSERNIDAEKPPTAPQSAAKSEAALSVMTEKGQESLEWKRAKVRLRSTPRSPSPPVQGGQHRVASADRVRMPSKEKPPSLAGGRAASGHTGLASCARSPTPPAVEKRFATSATQIEHQTADTGVQVKLKKKRSPSQRRARKERRSPSQRSVVSKLSSQSGSILKDDKEKTKKKKTKKKKKAKSRDPSVRSLRSLRSFQSDASAGILKHVKIDNVPLSPAISRNGRSGSVPKLVETKKRKKKSKVKKKKSSNKIARFLRTLSKDKEAIKVISNMAAVRKKSSK